VSWNDGGGRRLGLDGRSWVVYLSFLPDRSQPIDGHRLRPSTGALRGVGNRHRTGSLHLRLRSCLRRYTGYITQVGLSTDSQFTLPVTTQLTGRVASRRVVARCESNRRQSAGVWLSWHTTAPTRTPTPARTSSPTSARGSSRGCRRVRRLPCSACDRNRPNFVLHEPNTHEDPRRLVRHARFSSRGSSRGCPLGMRACTRVHVYNTTGRDVSRHAGPCASGATCADLLAVRVVVCM